VHDVVWLGR